MAEIDYFMKLPNHNIIINRIFCRLLLTLCGLLINSLNTDHGWGPSNIIDIFCSGYGKFLTSEHYRKYLKIFCIVFTFREGGDIGL